MLPTGEEKIFSNDLPVKELIFKLYKQLIGFKKKKGGVKKWAGTKSQSP